MLTPIYHSTCSCWQASWSSQKYIQLLFPQNLWHFISDDEIYTRFFCIHKNMKSFKAYDCCFVDLVDSYYVQCSSNFTSHGANWTVPSTFFSSTGVTFQSCQQLCSSNSSCISFYHRSDTLECHLSKSSVRTSADCSSCSYHIKQCWQGNSYSFFFFAPINYDFKLG